MAVFPVLLSSAINSSVVESLSLTVFVTATTLIYQRVSTSHDSSKVDESSTRFPTLFSHEGSGQPLSSNEQGDFSGSGSAIFLEELDREWELNQKHSALKKDLQTNVSSEDESGERLSSTFFDSKHKSAPTKEPENSALLSWVTWSPEWDAGSGQGGSGSLQSDDLPIQIIIPELTVRQSEDQNTGNTHTWANIW